VNLNDMHDYLGQLLAAGVDPKLPMTSLVDGMPCEVSDFVVATGTFLSDPAPKLTPGSPARGVVIVAIPMGEYGDHLREPNYPGRKPWEVSELPVECLALPALAV
jgi:hypothetical protein